MKIQLLACALILGALPFTAAARGEAPKAGSIAFILDCSRSMEEAVPDDATIKQVSDTEGSNAEEPTRMDVAQSQLRKMLRELAPSGTHHVGLWLYGHRLVWEADTKHPDLLSQDEYLEATVGFGALNGLLPGDDVEQAEAIKRFNAQDYERFVARLNVVKPWGEKPLYLAITRALEALADQPAAMSKSIVILTDGGNEQWLARFKTTQEKTGGELENNIVPIHFLHVGPRPDHEDATETELRTLAEQGGGSFRYVSTNTDIKVAQLLTSSRKVEVVSVSPAADTVEGKISEAAAILTRAPDRNISGSVIYYNKPVSSATVTLQGTDIAPVKTDRQGRFLIRKVPAGRQYHIVVKGIAQNSFREKALDLNIERDADEQPFVTIDLK